MSKLFKQKAAYLQQENKKYTATLVPMEFEKFSNVVAVFRSNRFLVQVYEPERNAQRISICRTMIDVVTGDWIDGITWQEIQDIKRGIGFGNREAVEVFPPDDDVVNVANMRHIWLVDPLEFSWRKKP